MADNKIVIFSTRYAVEHTVYVLQVTVALTQENRTTAAHSRCIVENALQFAAVWFCILSLSLLLVADICVYHRCRLHSGSNHVGGCSVMSFISCKYLLCGAGMKLYIHTCTHVHKHTRTCTCTHMHTWMRMHVCTHAHVFHGAISVS